MRLNLSTLMASKGLPTAYALERYSKGALSLTTATRLVKAKDRPKRVDLDTLEILCRVFGVTDMNVLLARDGPDATPPEPPAVTKRQRPASKRATKGKATPKAKGRQSRAAAA